MNFWPVVGVLGLALALAPDCGGSTQVGPDGGPGGVTTASPSRVMEWPEASMAGGETGGAEEGGGRGAEGGGADTEGGGMEGGGSAEAASAEAGPVCDADSSCAPVPYCRSSACACGGPTGSVAMYQPCSSGSDCQPGLVCIDNSGDGAFYCRPVCGSTADCTAGQPADPSIQCSPALCANGRATPVRVCVSNGHLARSYDLTGCCIGVGDGGPVSAYGCSDGTREGFVDVGGFPDIAGCFAAWAEGSLRTPPTGVQCGSTSQVAGVPCPVPADACAPGWHVCAAPPYGPTDVSSKVTSVDCDAQHGEFAIAVGDQHCEPCSQTGDGAACCGQACVQQNGPCIFPPPMPGMLGMTAWFGVIDTHKNTCGDIVSAYPTALGVLCCRGF